MARKPAPLAMTSEQRRLNIEATKLMEAAGDHLHMGDRLVAKKSLARNATDDAMSGNKIDKRKSSRSGGINLRAVAEVLAEEGLDPTVEIVRILRSGDLDPDTAARVQLELLQYCQPKLKSVDIKASVKAEHKFVGADQATRIAEEILKGGITG